MNNKQGFTLIELSIAIVIIGLLVGGVLVGNDLISTAQARSQISQVEKLQTAILTFKLKYNCIPGDCGSASTFGLGSSGNGDKVIANDASFECLRSSATGNCLTRSGTLASSGDFASMHRMRGDNQYFWVHLTAAGLFPGEFSEAAIDNTAVTAAQMPDYFPKDAFGKSHLVVFTWGGKLYLHNGITSLGASKNALSYAAGTSAAQMYYMAAKIGYGTPIATLTNGNFDDLTQGRKLMAVGMYPAGDAWATRLRGATVTYTGWTACVISDGSGGYKYNIENDGDCKFLWELAY